MAETRDLIVAAGLDLLERDGLAAMTQPKVAAAAGVRQSHLTYYFPRIGDLLIAVLAESHRRAGSTGDALEDARRVLFDRRRMAFFLRVVAELSESGELRPKAAEHVDGMAASLARRFGRDAADPAVAAFVDRLRGWALRHLLHPDLPEPGLVEIERAAREAGLMR